MKLNSPVDVDGSVGSVWWAGNAPGGVSLVLSLGNMSMSAPGRKGEEELCGLVAVRNRHSIFFSLLGSLITGWQMLSITGRRRQIIGGYVTWCVGRSHAGRR